ncbi:hypothetical protein [Desertimonas flava]|uniref:hypothetical protein n=1 Tax=Desertimonas flava TaxID=2064846 RepID=UPI0013C46265|nr:hypothetical protein [Desertimonas flava]
MDRPAHSPLKWLEGSLGSFRNTGHGDMRTVSTFLASYEDWKVFKGDIDALRTLNAHWPAAQRLAAKVLERPGPSVSRYPDRHLEFLRFRQELRERVRGEAPAGPEVGHHSARYAKAFVRTLPLINAVYREPQPSVSAWCRAAGVGRKVFYGNRDVLLGSEGVPGIAEKTGAGYVVRADFLQALNELSSRPLDASGTTANDVADRYVRQAS